MINDDDNDNNGDADGNPQFDDDDDGNAAALYSLYFNLFLKTRFCRLISVLLLHTIDGNDSVYAVNNNADNGRLNTQLSFLVTDLPTALTNNNKMNINDDDTTKLVYPLLLLWVPIVVVIISVPCNEKPML